MNPAERLARATGTLSLWRGKQEVLLEQLTAAEKAVSEAKSRLELKPKIDEVLLELQSRSQRRTVGVYEALLSQIFQEVLPNDSKAVSVNLTTANGSPSVEFLISRQPDGRTEDILAGNGGSVANVISAGLRFIALSRTNLRRFMVLDEADCWLAPSRVEAFANVVKQMGVDLGVQSLMISHHDPRLFMSSANSVVALDKDSHRISASVVYTTNEEPDPEGIKYVRLVDFMSHTDTTVPLSPGLTALIGPNDVGKSAVVNALAVLAGTRSFKKEYVRHGCSQGSVLVGLGDGRVVECTRNAKGSPAVMYRLFDAKGAQLHETPSTQPDWLADVLKIRAESGLDIQIGDQKRPVFLLDEPGSKQAAILSIGKESGRISEMQALYKARVAEDRQGVKQGEQTVARLRGSLEQLTTLDTCAKLLQTAELALAEAAATAKLEADLLKSLSALKRSAPLLAVERQLAAVQQPQGCSLQASDRLIAVVTGLSRSRTLAVSKVPPELSAPALDISQALRLTELLRKMSSLRLAPTPLPQPLQQIPVLQDATALKRMLAQLADSSLSRLPRVPGVPEVPVLDAHSADKGQRLIAQICARKEEITGATVQMEEAKAEGTAVEADLKQMVDALGGICPLCHGTTLSGLHKHAA